MCPSCNSDDLRIEPYDFGRDPETGYRDRGVKVTCRSCGEVTDAEEIDRYMETLRK